MRILYLPNEYSQQRQKEKKRWIYPIRLAMEATYYEKQGHTVIWGGNAEADKVITEPEGIPFLSLPHANRILTQAKDKRYQENGNFKYRPGTYILSASGCWYGKCRFCVENGEAYIKREVGDVVEEIKECKALGFKEVFDDSASFPIGGWLDEFCQRIKDVGIRFSCNFRAIDVDYLQLHKAGFRMLLFGIESANEETLRRIRKGTTNENIKFVIKAALAGIECHGAFMFGHPWETDEDAIRTLGLCHYLLRKGYLKTAQASLYSPQGMPGNQAHKKYVKKIYEAGYHADFWWNKLRSVRNAADLVYIWRGIKSAMSSY